MTDLGKILLAVGGVMVVAGAVRVPQTTRLRHQLFTSSQLASNPELNFPTGMRRA